jgi:hypothetical protein
MFYIEFGEINSADLGLAEIAVWELNRLVFALVFLKYLH